MSIVSLSITCRLLLNIALVILFMNGQAKAQSLPDLTEVLRVAKVSAPLTAEERAIAIQRAEESLRAKKLLPDRKTFLTFVQTHRNATLEKKGIFERHALLTYYRYAGDVGILVYVNLTRQKVESVEQLPHFLAPLAPAELARARELVLSEPRLRNVLQPLRDQLTIEALLTRIPDPKNPLFGHRLVHLLFRVGPRYLTAQGLVLVDLTTEQVIIQTSPERQGHSPNH